MRHQLFLRLEGLVTILAFERFSYVVNVNVLIQVSSGWELFVTTLTLMLGRLFAFRGVLEEYVIEHLVFLHESLIAMMAFGTIFRFVWMFLYRV